MPLYAVSYTVAGTTRFPTDMLRYDGSHPATGEDASLLADALDLAHGRPEAWDRKSIGVTLRHVSPTAKWLPTDERWRSFGWMVVPGSIRVQRL